MSDLEGVSALPSESNRAKKRWYQPTFSPEHGVLLVLLGAVLTGASLAQAWTSDTSWACLAAFLALQAEHPLVVQIKQRRRWRPRYLFWAGLYGLLTSAITLWLCVRHPVLLWIGGGGIVALAVDIWAVLQHKQKAIANEIVMFSALCLSTLFVYGATADTITVQAIGLWILNSLFFSGAVFSVKLRKVKTSSLKAAFVYHAGAIALVVLLYQLGWLSLFTALASAIALLKLAIITQWQHWYRSCRFEYIARFETYFALSYTVLVALTLLPPKLPHG
ncbi:MAG: YwiC-like protein [Phormidesmis priestleyi Ana]|uniref:YwiC-like protein n=1 Tax=Phormidesmis priestleyi Ana TaxID=1666911 RepID=A0A0P8BJQ8_9CYAN|nr:MAG: YwiC-like protein [Phormidesmis priestleyi Ana]